MVMSPWKGARPGKLRAVDVTVYRILANAIDEVNRQIAIIRRFS